MDRLSAQAQKLVFRFPGADVFAFLYENAHLLLLSFPRDAAKFLFLIKEDADGLLSLDYPGEKFTDVVLDTISNILTVQIQEEGETARRYALGSYFVVDSVRYGAWYERDTEAENPDVVLFSITGEAQHPTLEIPGQAEYEKVAAAFVEQHREVVHIANLQIDGEELG